ncbi:Mitochondrial porin [Ophidiomyces ophidiicola]|uniref:Mitochondrial porin n=1 Tax=Ophidiomyces ophidiicola TaxID=1387563 RepID=A0ACB8UPG3_9EURO|nr:Mitochondrial porin [Ophidiomyces ophidiicola]KAI1907240.1 Mitochondrial porin [Ophidiomyces ophidiicola]KAI1907495.1 Mitochondrial porin [Ophidiomyces ophidiicola]KAI1921931.1 Mitochondrial porin [Ophidiomyces ophidiicola]KAI1940859.1 Mitochondrial porin [Ophidiomyces ophidiicola]KAI1975750.1 Mitochondrial porin [Ophidiomyces ophidiicola]
MAAPAAFGDIAKTVNDLLNKDFYHTSPASLEVKSKAPNGVTFNVKGKSAHEGAISGSLEAKYVDAPTGKYPSNSDQTSLRTATHASHPSLKWIPLLSFSFIRCYTRFSTSSLASTPLHRIDAKLISCSHPGLTLTQTWNTGNALDTKLELDNNIAKGLKAEVLTQYLPYSNAKGAKLNLHFKQPNLHARAFFDLLKGPTANFDAVLGHEGFIVGAEGGYDVQKAAITKYSAAVAYSLPEYSAAITATNNLTLFSASYYHRVNAQVEAGAKATWDSKAGNTVGLEVASKYRLDPSSFAKAKINDRGIAALAYNILLRPGVTLGLGASFDTQNLNQAAHKVGASFTFEG